MGVVRILLSPVSLEEIYVVEKERKARTILLMAIPKEHLRRFHGMDDAKEIWEAIWNYKSSTNKVKSGYTGAYSTCTPTSSNNIQEREVPAKQIDDVDIEEMDINWQIAMTCFSNERSSTKVGTLSYEEEMNRTVFKCTEGDFLNKPLYSRFSKSDNFNGVPHPLTGDYTPKPQEEIDDSLYVYGKKGPQKPKISDSDDNSTEHSTYQSNDYEGSFGNPSEHSSEFESESISVSNGMSASKANVNSVRQNVNSVRTNINTIRSKQPVPTNNTNNFSSVRPQGNWGTAIKTSTGYNWWRTRPNSNYNSGSNFVRTVNVKGPQGRPKSEKA
ncbi:hypothetical protein Tco_0696167 [Tanacetum coccineum]